jgi:GNAT superfamily N-acetyltransferase
MTAFEIRTFRRADRDQVTRLVSTHAAAVLPGAGVSANAVLSQFEREPDEFVVDPWVAERRALVAEQSGAIVAAALVVRHRDDADVAAGYRGAGEIRWLVFRPEAPAGHPHWQDGRDAAQALLLACLHQLTRWQVTRTYADGALPVPGVYGVPEQWPHIADLFARNGFAPSGAPEIVLMADVAGLAALPDPSETPPLPGLTVRRSVGINGTRFAAVLPARGERDEHGERTVGMLEVDVLDHGERHPLHGGLADIGNLDVDDDVRRHGVGALLMAHAAQWLRLGRVERLLAYASPDETALLAFLARHRFVEITCTRRGWERPPGAPTAR